MISRRKIIQASLAGLFPKAAFAMSNVGVMNLPASESGVIDWSYGMKPLFCVAYIDPGIKAQQGQEREVAKFPIALVPQDDRSHFKRWRDKVRRYNPDIKLLGYQMVIEETRVPGPGHRKLAQAKNSWIKYANGFTPTVTYRTNVSGRRKRIYDPRSASWQEAFLDACSLLIESSEFNGVFLDQCTVFQVASLFSDERGEMLAALNETLHALRSRHPHSLIIGNSSYSWPALNGEMNEGRPKKLLKEFAVDKLRKVPRLEMFQYYHAKDDEKKVAHYFREAINNKAFFGSTINAQTARWLNTFDQVLSEYQLAV